MTTKAIQLAKECGIFIYKEGDFGGNSQSQLETFYARAQAQALREAIKHCDLTYQVGWVSETKLRALADELERYAGEQFETPNYK